MNVISTVLVPYSRLTEVSSFVGIPVVTNQKLLGYQFVHCNKCWLCSSLCLRNNFAIGATDKFLNVYLNINNPIAIYKIFSDIWK